MTDVRAVGATDRLPWLEDEPALAKPKLKRAANPNLWALAAALLLLVVALGSYWLGTRTSNEEQPSVHRSPTLVAPLPQPRAPEVPQVQTAPEPQVEPTLAPEVRFAPPREVRIERPRPVKGIVVQNPAAPPEESTEESASAPAATQPVSPPVASVPAPVPSRPLKAWPAWQSAGAKGRIVRIGAFGTRDQAKFGWRYMVDAYPAVAHLKATVVADRNSRGRHFYRFQIGTTSQAHSEVLCQRMEKIHLSCAVVGLPWQPHGVER
ncbi:MAG TPA: hypothetical protein VFW39_10075 [Sphingomicrobium sp.]|nr:hypothetical protein [Sphingomicrobium sp.]